VFKGPREDKLPVQDSESDDGLLLNELEDKLIKNLNDTALRYSNCPGFLDEVLPELHALGAPKAALMLVEAVKAEGFPDRIFGPIGARACLRRFWKCWMARSLADGHLCFLSP
jgi:hypothetical protein